ncbi:unnamed protein product, partial [marine sediment metagenome]
LQRMASFALAGIKAQFTALLQSAEKFEKPNPLTISPINKNIS